MIKNNSMKNSEKSIEKKSVPSGNNKDSMVPPSKDAAKDLRELFIASLKDIYWAENALVHALPKMAANATSPGLKSAIKDHLDVTKLQIERLDKVFKTIKVKPEGKKCEAMAGLLKEGDSILEETTPGAVRDAGIIAASQKIEHYEIATYGTLVSFAKTLGENDASKLLTQTLAEEKESDCVLNDIALNAVNADATE